MFLSSFLFPSKIGVLLAIEIASIWKKKKEDKVYHDEMGTPQC